ncbi:MAG TPA: DUF4198 domain-containing protein [Thermotogota bacterium]|nr:DUF4198 domain-containing protein [Thermotogota bacterium]HPJ88835.1 DUF4198 domain-containing protein [Thermotogota bacterium]HPR96698.1 DUF4198 domain-containing protein [Thermotogota bacterium]
MKRVLMIAIALALVASATFAHFQMIYTPDVFLSEDESSKIDLELIFTHPGGGTHDSIPEPLTMNMAQPTKFGVWNKGEFTELTDQLEKFTFTHGERSADAYRMSYRCRGMGDFMFTLEPGAYYEASEGIYITQYSKIIVNRAGLPTDWAEETGMKAEIVPLNWPINLYAGTTFRGIVMMDGEPVANAEIEVEYLNKKAFKGAFDDDAPILDFDGGESPAMAFATNENGEFSFSFPWAGWWGFVALMEGEPIDGTDQEVGAAIFMKVENNPF